MFCDNLLAKSLRTSICSHNSPILRRLKDLISDDFLVKMLGRCLFGGCRSTEWPQVLQDANAPTLPVFKHLTAVGLGFTPSWLDFCVSHFVLIAFQYFEFFCYSFTSFHVSFIWAILGCRRGENADHSTSRLKNAWRIPWDVWLWGIRPSFCIGMPMGIHFFAWAKALSVRRSSSMSEPWLQNFCLCIFLQAMRSGIASRKVRTTSPIHRDTLFPFYLQVESVAIHPWSRLA